MNGSLALPDAEVWDLAPSFRPDRVAPGARWVDTLHFSAQRDGHRQSSNGIRVSRLLRDTTVDGRTLWLVRDSVMLSYDEQQLQYERTLAALVIQERRVSGTVTGVRIQDATMLLPLSMEDTARLEGHAVLHYPDGRSFHTTARYERFRRRDLYNAAAYAARIATLRTEYEAHHSGGMIFYPDAGSVEERVRTGDTVARDSLLAVLRSTQDPMERSRAYGQLGSWWAERALPQTIDAALEAGDTAWLAGQYAQRLFDRQLPNDTTALRFMQPFMSDPALAFAFGLDRDPFYENLRDPLLYRPPAAARGAAVAGCAPAVCALLSSFADTAREPRLRDLGLLARLVTDPARWANEVRQRADSSVMLRLAAPLLDGAPIFVPGNAGPAVPAAGAPWSDWLEWTTSRGRIPDSISVVLNKPRIVHAEDAHRVAIRFTELLTGRNVQEELRTAFDTTTADSARLVFGALLLALGELQPEPEELARRLQQGSAADRDLARRELFPLMHDPPPADSATIIELLDALLESRVNGTRPWPHLDRSPEQGGEGRQPRDTIPLFIHAEDLPGSLRQRWEGRVRVFTDEPPDRRVAHSVVDFGPVRQIGPFALVSITNETWDDRRPEQAAAGFADGTDYLLLRTDRGWVIVATSSWVT
jgi:hypothetical protein